MADVRAKLARWADEWKLALRGVGLAFQKPKFVALVIVIFMLFGTLMGMLAYAASWTYLFKLPDLATKMGYLVGRFCSIFAWENISMLIISLLQAVLIGMIVLLYKKNKSRGGEVQKAGIVTGLAILAGGCPTCGTSLLMPLIGAMFSGSSAVVGSAISWILTVVAIIIALLAFKKLGEETYVIIVSEKRRKHGKA